MDHGPAHVTNKVKRPTPEDDLEGVTDVPLLKVTDLQKSYEGHAALEGISFKLYPGDILGLLGPNGAGKTTILRILATVIKPSSGSAEIDGKPLDDVDHARKKIGYMPDFIGSYDELKVSEYMEFFARANLVASDKRELTMNEALSTTGLKELKDRPVAGLSQDQTQRLALARLLMHDPALLLLDEPVAGLDPPARVHLKDILKELQTKGKAIIVSSNVLDDLTDLCNKIAVLDQGVLLGCGCTKSLLTRLSDSPITGEKA
jgi:ABC-2 type transport system ATP-binding protein